MNTDLSHLSTTWRSGTLLAFAFLLTSCASSEFDAARDTSAAQSAESPAALITHDPSWLFAPALEGGLPSGRATLWSGIRYFASRLLLTDDLPTQTLTVNPDVSSAAAAYEQLIPFLDNAANRRQWRRWSQTIAPRLRGQM